MTRAFPINRFGLKPMALLALAAVCCLASCGDKAANQKPVVTYRGESASHWARALSDREADYRVLATVALEAIGADGAEAVPALAKALEDETPAVRAGAAQALGAMGASAKSAEPALAKAMEDKEVEVRMNAIFAMDRITGTSAVDPLVNALKDENPRVREVATQLLVKMGPPAVASVSRLMKEENPDLRYAALNILGRIKHADAVPTLVAALDDSDRAIRDAAVLSFAPIGEATIPALTTLLKDPQVEKRWAAAYALNALNSPKAAEPLVTALNDKDSRVRDLAAAALTRIGKDAIEPLAKFVVNGDLEVRLVALNALAAMARPETIPVLHGALKDPEPSIRDAAVAALGNTGSAKAIPALTEAISSNDIKVRSDAVAALVKLGKDSLPVLITAAGDKDALVRRVATDGLGMLADPSSAATLNKLLTDEDTRVRAAAAQAIAKIGPAAKLSITPLINTLKDKNDEVRDGAAFALAKLAPGNDTVIPALIRTLVSDDVRARVGAANAIARLGPMAPSAVHPLINGLKDAEEPVVLASRLALVKLGPEAITGILKALREEDAKTRLHLIDVLGQIGPDAAPAVHVLLVLLQDDNAQIRAATVHTLGLIGGEAKSALLKASRGEDQKLAAAAASALETILKQN